MVNVLSELWARFNVLLINASIPFEYHNHYRKWLRYYLDFCKKYRFPEAKRDSLIHFISKLQEKQQTQEQQNQASHAVSLYYGLLQAGSKEETPLTQPFMSQRLTKENENIGRGTVSVRNDNWKAA